MSLPSPRVIVLLVVALIASAIAAVAIRSGDDDSKVASASSSTTTSTTVAAPSTTLAPGTSAPPPAATTPVPTGQARILKDIEAQVSELRGLAWKAPLDLEVANDTEFVRQLNLIIARDLHLDRMKGDEVTLKVLKLIPENSDYLKIYNDLLGGAVLGFYDPKTKKLLVRSSGTLSPEQRITVAHEMDHALTDQYFDFGTATDVLDREDRSEEGSGFTAIIEGDAKLLEAQWAQKYLSAKERAQAAGETSSGADVYRTTPPFIVDSLLFPYTTGRSFVAGRYRAGGWAVVNDLYRRPPNSTQAVLHPNLYLAGKTWAPPPFPNLAAATGCTPVRTNNMGEFTMSEILQAYIAESTASAAANDWNGDTYATIRCGASRGFADRWVSDPDSAATLSNALGQWAQRYAGSPPPGPDGRFIGSSRAGRIVHNGARVDLIVGDDIGTVNKISAALGD